MSHSSDIKAKNRTTTGSLVIGRARIRGIHVLAAAGNPQLVIKDGSGGTTILDVKFTAHASETNSHTLFIPDDGILSVNDPHLTLTDLTQVTVFYA